MAATVIDGAAGTLSYYLFRVSDGVGGLQQTITAIPLGSYHFTDAFLGRSAFSADNWTSGSVDEFRIYNEARSGASILGDFNAGPNSVPEPGSLTLLGSGVLAFFLRRRSGGVS
jgi:PEP-CTERM motif